MILKLYLSISWYFTWWKWTIYSSIVDDKIEGFFKYFVVESTHAWPIDFAVSFCLWWRCRCHLMGQMSYCQKWRRRRKKKIIQIAVRGNWDKSFISLQKKLGFLIHKSLKVVFIIIICRNQLFGNGLWKKFCCDFILKNDMHCL